MEIVYQKNRGVKLTPVIKAKSEKVKTREIKKLMQQFPCMEERVIRVVYANSQCDLSAVECPVNPSNFSIPSRGTSRVAVLING